MLATRRLNAHSVHAGFGIDVSQLRMSRMLELASEKLTRSVPCSTDGRPGQPTTMSENLNTITTTTLIHKSKLIFGIFDFSFS
jgi:hypothetical protein